MSGEGSPRGVLVTGGSSGIGRAVARAHARAGDHVVVLDRDRPTDPEDDIVYVEGDVACYADNVRAVDTVVEVAGCLNHFVGNAGIHDGGFGFTTTSGPEIEAIVRRVFEVNVLGYLLGARASAQHLLASSGCMTFTLSDASFIVSGNGAGVGYTTSKHAGLGLVRHLASELAPRVRVNVVAPGGVITGLRAQKPDGSQRGVFGDDAAEITSAIAKLNPLQVVLTPEQLADLYLFLASPQAVGLTGEVLRPDGGLSVRTSPEHFRNVPKPERSRS